LAPRGSLERAAIGTVHAIDGLNDWIGRIVAWLTLGCVLVCFVVVVLRYLFSIGYVWMQELYVWQHAFVFMVGAGYTYLKGGHVRVDIFYSAMSPRRKAMVDIFGTTFFLLPWLTILLITSWSFVTSSWWIFEWSQQADGLPGYFVLKSAIWVFAFVVGLQGIATVLRNLLFLAGHQEFAPSVPPK